jgi:menaquinone-dependent protoporphyrinogen oxidase
MKSIILYDSKYGSTKKCAQIIKENNKTEMVHIKDFSNDIKDYDSIVIMSPVYMGQIKKSIKTFLESNHHILLSKKLTICITAMNTDEYTDMLKRNFEQVILESADFIYAGGAYYFEKMNFIYRFIVKKIAGVSKTTESINYSKLKEIRL